MFKKNWRRPGFIKKQHITNVAVLTILVICTIITVILLCGSKPMTVEAVKTVTSKQIINISLTSGPIVEGATPITKPEYSTEELEIVAKVIAAEVGNSSYDCQKGVAQVIYDRLQHPNKTLYGGYSIVDVINWPNQFDSSKSYKNKDLSLYPTALQAATDVFINGAREFDKTTVIIFRPDTSSVRSVRTLREYNYIATIDGNEFRGDMLG